MSIENNGQGEPIYPTDYELLQVAARHNEHQSYMAELFERTSAAVSIYEAFGLLAHEAAIQTVFEAIRPPDILTEPSDLEKPGARAYYARFLSLATEDGSDGEVTIIEDQFRAARAVYSQLLPATLTLNSVLGRTRNNKITAKSYENTIKILDHVAEEIRAGSIEL